jgi:hypothetical protein
MEKNCCPNDAEIITIAETRGERERPRNRNGKKKHFNSSKLVRWVE